MTTDFTGKLIYVKSSGAKIIDGLTEAEIKLPRNKPIRKKVPTEQVDITSVGSRILELETDSLRDEMEGEE